MSRKKEESFHSEGQILHVPFVEVNFLHS